MDIKKDLMEWPEQIKNQELAVADAAQEIGKLNAELESFRLQIRADVAEEKDGTKNKFPNETLRDAEVEKRLQNITAYSESFKKLKSEKLNLESAQIELRYRLNMFSALKTIAQMREG